MNDTARPSACPNCGAPFGHAMPTYCPCCGQESRLRPPTVSEYLQQLGGAYFATEGALWRSLKLLLRSPGQLSVLYLAGQRRRYVQPLRLFLSASVVLVLALRVTSLLEERAPGHAVDANANLTHGVSVELGFGNARIENGVYACTRLPAWLCARLHDRLVPDLSATLATARAANQRFFAHASVMSFVLLPAFALGLKLAYGNRALRYTEHGVVALHLHAYWALVTTIVVVAPTGLAGIGLPWMLAYAVIALHRVYRGRWWPQVLRALLLCGAQLVLVLASVAILFTAMLLAS